MLAKSPAHSSAGSAAIAHLSLPKRVRNALLRAGIVTLEDAKEWSERDLLSLPHFGRASVAAPARANRNQHESQLAGDSTATPDMSLHAHNFDA